MVRPEKRQLLHLKETGIPTPREGAPQGTTRPAPARPQSPHLRKTLLLQLVSPKRCTAEFPLVLELGLEVGTLGKSSWACKAAAKEAAPLLTGGSSRCLNCKAPGTPGHWPGPHLQGSPGPKGPQRLLLSDSGAP